MTTYTELTDKAAEQLLTAVKPLNDLTKKFADAAADTASKLPTLPRPEGVPTALEVVTAHFAFAEKVFSVQKDFALDLAGATTAPAKAKAGAKS